jgi:flagellar protein FliO/FliZ
MGSSAEAGGGLLGQVVGVVLALGLVLVLAWLVLKLLSRTMQGAQASGPGGATPLRVERVLAIGARERLVLVRHGDELLLLGVTAGSVNVLQRSPAAAAEPPAP